MLALAVSGLWGLLRKEKQQSAEPEHSGSQSSGPDNAALLRSEAKNGSASRGAASLDIAILAASGLVHGLFVCGGPLLTEEQQPAEADMGDANCDEKVDLNDAVAILQYAALPAKYPLTDQGMLNADVIDNGTSGVNGVDALAVQMVDAKLISTDKLPITKAAMEELKK